MSSLTWDSKNEREVRTAEDIFFLYEKLRFYAKHKGKYIRSFNPKHETLTFEPHPTAYARILEESPWE